MSSSSTRVFKETVQMTFLQKQILVKSLKKKWPEILFTIFSFMSSFNWATEVIPFIRKWLALLFSMLRKKFVHLQIWKYSTKESKPCTKTDHNGTTSCPMFTKLSYTILAFGYITTRMWYWILKAYILG